MRRLILLAIVALVLAPGTWVRSDIPEPDLTAPLNIRQIAPPSLDIGEMELTGMWRLSSEHPFFGGYSALLYEGGGRFFSGSDQGRSLLFDLPEGDGPIAEMRPFNRAGAPDKRTRDLESLTRDPITGQIWAGYEFTNMIARFDADLNLQGKVRPQEMRSWSDNAGPEAMARLTDGRFVVLSESSEDGALFAGVLFAGDPVEGAEAQTFQFRPPADFRPVDMIQLSDDRALILVRKVVWGFPPTFEVKLLVADFADIGDDAPWQGKVVATLADSAISENYEGLAEIGDAFDQGAIFVISDDNDSKFQRTLLLKLRWKDEPTESSTPDK